MRGFGSASMTGTLERVLVRPPLAEDAVHWREYGWRAAPDPAAAAAEHEALCGLLEGAGAEVVVSRHEPGNPDAIYVYDPVLVGSEGAVLLRPGKGERRGEPDALTASLESAGVPVAARVDEPALVEGGDTLWLDEATLLVGIGYRTNEPAVAALEAAFPGTSVIAFDLPHWNGDGEVLHLMSFISPLDRDLALVYPRLAPVRLLKLLAERRIEIVEVPDEEFESQGRTSSRSGRAVRSPSTAIPRHGGAWSGREWTSSSTAATRYRGKGTAAPPASRGRSCASRRERTRRRTRAPSAARPRGPPASTPRG